jgi:hypothetical protein
VRPMQSNYTSGKSTPRSGNLQTNGPETDGNAWDIPLEHEETIFMEWRISHYRAMLKLTLAAQDRVNLNRMLADTERHLAMRKLYLAKVEAFIC